MKNLKQFALAVFSVLFLGRIFLFSFPLPAHALCDGGITGPKVAGNFANEWLDLIRQEYDDKNPDCTGQRIPVTVLFVFDPNQPDQRTNWASDLTRIDNRNLRPIIRIAGNPSGGAWSRLSIQNAQSAALSLNGAVSRSGVNDVIVYFGNEPNLPAEWGNYGATVEERLKDFALSFAAFADTADTNLYSVFIPPLALHQSAGYSVEQGWIRDIILPALPSGKISGAALTLYNTSADALDADYTRMANFYAPKGINRIIASEVGAIVGTGPAQDTCHLAKWKEIMTDLFSRRTPLQVPGLLAGAEVVNTSFFEDKDCDGDPDWTHLVVIDENGNVEVGLEFEGGFVTLEDQLAAEGRSYRLSICCTQLPGSGQTRVSLPGSQPTEWGNPVYGRGVPCGPLRSDRSGPSPWRPFPGDSPQDSCYDLTKITPPGENEREWITTYCNPAPIITDIINWFPLPDYSNPGADIKGYFLRPVELKTWWINQTQATQIPFLGSSNTSSRQFSEASQRMSLFLTDFLRGIVYWDRQQVQPNNSAEYRRVLDESGPIRKLYPRDFLSGGEADDWKKEFIRCRLKGRTNCDQLVSTDPVHDYLLRSNVRLSTSSKGSNVWDRYFPLTSREDIPAFVDLGVSMVWPGNPKTIPGIQVSPADPSVPSSISLDDLYNALADGGGYYWIALPWSSSISSLPLYELHFVEMVYIPYVPESKELAQWAARPLMPFAFENPDSPDYWLNDSSLNTLALDNPFGRSLNCNVNDIARGGPGDVLAGDNPANLERYLRFYNEWERIVTSTDPSQWGCFTSLHNPNYQPPDRLHFPERTENVFTRNTGEYPEWPYAWVTTKIPYLETIARRTIGKGGLFRALLPRSFTHSVVSAIDEVAQGRIWWYELPGYGPADHDYENFLEEQEDRPHWGLCDPVPPERCDAPVSSCNDLYNCSQVCDGCELVELGTEHQCLGDCVVRISRCCRPEERDCDNFWPVAVRQCQPNQPGETCSCEDAPYQANCIIEESGFSGEAPCWCYCEEGGSGCGPGYGPTLDSQGRDIRGRDEVNDAEARFYYPYIGTIDIFRQYMRDQMVPHNFFRPRT